MNSSTVRLSKNLASVAHALDAALEAAAGQRVAFTLLVFTEGRASYISNAKREECVAEIERLLGLWKQGMPDIPAHEYAS